MQQGYKQTEVGMIPEDWDLKHLNDFGDVISGGTPSTSVGEYWDGDIAWCTPSDITSTMGKYIYKTDRNITHQGLKNSAATILPPNSILLCTRATIGELKLSGVPMATNQGFKNLCPNATGNVDYLYYLLQTKKKDMVELAIGSTFLEISKKALCSIALQTPSLPEQGRIAEALSDVDGMISSLEKLIAKKKAVKQGAMQELLTGKKRLPGFTGEWAHMELGKYGSLMKETINPQVYSSEYFWEYSMPAFDEGRTPIKQKGADMHSNRTVICGKVLLFNKLNVRQKRIWLIDQCRDNAVCSSEFLPYKSDAINLELLSQILYTDKVTLEFIGMSTGTSNSQKRITPDAFLEYKVYLPVNEKEQAAIANVFSCMDNEIEALEQKLEKTRQIKQGMMQQLLTGKIRLV